MNKMIWSLNAKTVCYLIKVEDHPDGVAADKDDNNQDENHRDILVPLLASCGPAHHCTSTRNIKLVKLL